MPQLSANGIRIDNTFAEAFAMRATAIIITAPTGRWARQAAQTRNRVAIVLAGFFLVAAAFAFIQWQRARSSGLNALHQGLLNLSTLSNVQSSSGQQLDALLTARATGTATERAR